MCHQKTTKIKRQKTGWACAIIESTIANCPLIWMFCLKIDIQRVEKKQKIWNFTSGYNNCMATYDDLLALETHQKHLQFKAIEIYKSKN